MEPQPLRETNLSALPCVVLACPTLQILIGLAAQADGLGCGLRGPCARWITNAC